jgi:hypothetical protein
VATKGRNSFYLDLCEESTYPLRPAGEGLAVCPKRYPQPDAGASDAIEFDGDKGKERGEKALYYRRRQHYVPLLDRQ